MKKLLTVLLVLALLSVTTFAFAATELQNGLSFTLETNKESYAAGEQITATVTAKNNNPFTIGPIEMKHVVPDGYTLAQGSVEMLNLLTLKSGASVTHEVVYVNGDNLPSTGDNSQLVLWGSMVALSLLCLIIVLVKNGKAVRVMSLILCVAILASMITTPFASADASSPICVVELKETVLVDNMPIEVRATVSYIPADQTGQIFNLTASESVLTIGENDDELILYLETDMEVDYVDLYYGETGPVNHTLLYDNGKGADDIAGDFIYSAAVDAGLTSDGRVTFVAKTGKRSSNEVEVAYYTPISDATLAAMEAVNDDILTLLNGDAYQAMNEEQKLEKVKQLVQNHEQAGNIEQGSIEIHEDLNLVSFLYPEGILGGVDYREFDPEMNGSSNTRKEVYDSHTVYTVPAASLSAVVKTDDEEELGTAVILNSFPIFETEQDDIDYRTGFYETLEQKWDNAGLETTLIVNPTVVNYQQLDDYNVVCISTHGGTYKNWWDKIPDTPAIILAETATKAKNKAYSALLKDNQIVKWNSEYAILPQFFEQQYDENDFSNTFVYSECCQALGYDQGANSSQYNYSMANAFMSRSAKGYIGFHNSVFADYSRDMMEEYVDKLIDGETAKDAYDYIISQYGANHAIWFENAFNMTLKYFTENVKNPPEVYRASYHIAYPVRRGDDSEVLVDGLRNGDFEKYSLFTSTPKYWEMSGDVRSMKALGPLLSPTTFSKRMAFVSTGIGSQNNAALGGGTEGSMLYQTFRLPKDAKVLMFNYNFVSEEPMEYVGSAFDDAFAVRITSGGKTRFEHTYATVNSATWIPVSGIDFVGGDHTTYHTGWDTVSIDVSELAGKKITLSFIIYDVGDEIYDSACLIDNVQVK